MQILDQFLHTLSLYDIDGRAELGPGRSKGGLSTQGKPKKGRGQSIIAREAKRSRPSTEPDYEDEDDPDMNMYGHGSLI